MRRSGKLGKPAHIALLVIAAIAVAVWLARGGVEQTARERIESALVANGLPLPISACMAERLSARLTVGQLRELERLATELKAQGSAFTIGGLLEEIGQIEDRQIVEVTASSAAICAFSA